MRARASSRIIWPRRCAPTAAIAEAARGKTDVDCRAALPRDLGEWRSTVEFALGPYGAARDLDEISTQDLSRSVERDLGAFCRQGYGALLAKLAEGIPVQLNAPVTQIEFANRGNLAVATTPKGNVNGKYVIVTASTQLLAAERIKFEGGLPKRQLDALDKLKLGSFDHIVLELPGNPLGLQLDDLVFEKSSGPRTAALLANMGGTPLSVVSVGGRFGRELVAKGDKAAVEFAMEWLAAMFGTDLKRALKAHARDQLERRAVGAGCGVGRVAGRPVGAQGSDGAGAWPRLFRRRSAARDDVGHGRGRVGIRRARGERPDPTDRRLA